MDGWREGEQTAVGIKGNNRAFPRPSVRTAADRDRCPCRRESAQAETDSDVVVGHEAYDDGITLTHWPPRPPPPHAYPGSVYVHHRQFALNSHTAGDDSIPRVGNVGRRGVPRNLSLKLPPPSRDPGRFRSERRERERGCSQTSRDKASSGRRGTRGKGGRTCGVV